jgi:DNA-binding NarL/FixJ family response regulator
MMKKYHDPQWLNEQIALGKTSKDISKELNVSYKLIEIYLRKFGIAA